MQSGAYYAGGLVLTGARQVIFAMMQSPQEDDAVFNTTSEQALSLGGMESTVATCKGLHEGGERLCPDGRRECAV